MFNLPINTDLDFLLGEELIQIAFSKVQIQFRYTNNIIVSVESSCRFVDAAGKEHLLQPPNLEEIGKSAELLGCKISKYKISETSDVLIFSDGGQTLTILKGGINFESYQISSAAGTIIV
jgi:hypothetical protein